jgi:PAS domain S-box-containing protein
VSPSVTAVLGFTPEERLAQTVGEQLTPTSLSVIMDALARELARENQGSADPNRSVTLECEYYHKDGSTRWLENVISPLRDGRGALIGLHGVSRDIAERKRADAALRESEGRVRAKLEAILSPEGDIGLLGLAEILDVPELQRLMDDFFSLTRIGVAFVDLRGKVLVATGWQDICTKFHRVHPETLKNCIQSDTLLSQGAESGTCRTYLCQNQMRDIATPITVGGKPIGNLFLGQFLFEDEPLDYELFRARARRYGFDEKEYLAAYERVPRWSREKVDTVMSFYMQFAAMLSKLGHSNLKLARSAEALRKSEEKYRSLFNNANEAIFVAQGERLVFSNPMTARLLDYSQDEIRTKAFVEFIHPDDRDMVMGRHLKRLRGEKLPPVYSFRVVNRVGHTRWVDISAVLIDWEGQPATLNFVSDITERRRAEEAVQAALREKEVLLKEVHHRVKNNMQVISSLFSLQADHIEDAEARRILKEGQARVRSMALVHEKLYQSGNLSKIDFGGYLQSLAVHLFQAMAVDEGQVRLEEDLGEVSLDINAAVPCGLLANELISNALEHAFSGGQRGVIRLGLRRLADGDVELRVADDGAGFPEGLDFRLTQSLGLQIVNLLVSQLDGTIELDRRNGTAFTIRFRDTKPAPGRNPAAGT